MAGPESRRPGSVSRVPEDEPAVFLEVSVADASAAVPNGIAGICLAVRDEFGLIPHV